jgi:hypothetical protein
MGEKWLGLNKFYLSNGGSNENSGSVLNPFTAEASVEKYKD